MTNQVSPGCVVTNPTESPASMHRSLVLTPRGPLTHPTVEIRQSVARAVLLGQLAFMYGGGFQYLEMLSIWVLYANYVVMFGCSLVCYARDCRARRNAHAMLPYGLWYVVFSLWIVWVACRTGLPEVASWDVVRGFIKALVVWPAVAAVLPDRRHLRRFGGWVAGAVAFNAVVSCLTPTHPDLFAFILRTDDVEYAARYGQIARPGGIWGNGNSAAHAFLFAALLSVWAPCLWRWMARGVAVLGIYLSASRQGVYLFTLSSIVYGWCVARTCSQSGRVLLLLGWTVCVAIVCGVLILGYQEANEVQVIGARNITRVAELDVGAGSRLDIALMSIEKAMEGPWHGQGALSFRHYLIQYGPSEQERGTHNIYLAIWGEAGLPMLAAYLLVLAWGLQRALKVGLNSTDRVVLALMWICYLLIGFSWHGQMGDFNGLLFTALLFVLPSALTPVVNTPRCHGACMGAMPNPK